jgi:hypothetical protein
MVTTTRREGHTIEARLGALEFTEDPATSPAGRHSTENRLTRLHSLHIAA